MTPPPPKHTVVEKDGYRITFYPGFAREVEVEDRGDRKEIYRQSGSHDVRNQPDEPLTHHVVRIEGGRSRRDVTLTLDDPQHAIAEIVVKLHPAGRKPGEGTAQPAEETVRMVNDAVLCPPIC